MNQESKIVFGIVPSRRLGKSLGISPIPRKSCNYSCVYCHLGRTTRYVKERQNFFTVDEIIGELHDYLSKINPDDYDVITIVGDGEPSLFKGLNELVERIKKIQSKPVAIISNGGLLEQEDVYQAFLKFDIVLLNFDAWDEESHKKINRPLKSITFESKMKAYERFSHEFKGTLYFEVMMIRSINDKEDVMDKILSHLQKMRFDKVFVNAPVRPPAEDWVEVPDKECIQEAREKFNANNMAYLPEADFDSPLKDPFQAILNIISRHPMNYNDISSFLEKKFSLNSEDERFQEIIKQLRNDERINNYKYRGLEFFRRK